MILELRRPLAFFDLETTGVDPLRDKIVEFSMVRIDPDGARESKTLRINPGRPIPPEATAVHGIGDEDVKGAPAFREVARDLLDLLRDSDLAGSTCAGSTCRFSIASSRTASSISRSPNAASSTS